MHPPGTLEPQLVPETQLTYLQAQGWMHASPPADPPAIPVIENTESQNAGKPEIPAFGRGRKGAPRK